MKPARHEPPYRTNAPPPAHSTPEPSRSVASVAALLVGCSAMVVLTAWWWVWIGAQFPIQVY